MTITGFDIFLIAVAMSIDAFSVAFGIGCRYCTLRHYFRLSFHFGLFQFLMPIAGAFIGRSASKYFARMDIVAAVILFAIAAKMFHDALKSEEDRCSVKDPTRGFSLVALSLATSIDALGVGVSLSVRDGSIIGPAAVIGIVCVVFTAFGVYSGSLSRNFIGRYAEFLGAAVLIFIGIKFLFV